ncbi:hypothetical protein CPB84DRAFT_1784101 [Gymnopilus junonius]|uniref:F-box domain-containing protein n=1 Tax=Gymnopilus junonius TaxID=109634 RepID=A0A9P5NLW6_GYMJU|nr:hypothetical protein CPB84DRAFT_1784101 [Gymnopilus junonius]
MVDHTQPSRTFEDDIKAPLVLGAICRGWREIAWSIPDLWTYIDVWLDSRHCHFRLVHSLRRTSTINSFTHA